MNDRAPAQHCTYLPLVPSPRAGQAKMYDATFSAFAASAEDKTAARSLPCSSGPLTTAEIEDRRAVLY